MSPRQGQQRESQNQHDTLLLCSARQSDKRHHAELGVPQTWRGKRETEMNVQFELGPADQSCGSAATTWIWASFCGWINFANIFYWWYFGSLLDSFKVTCHLIGWGRDDTFVVSLPEHFILLGPLGPLVVALYVSCKYMSVYNWLGHTQIHI